METLSVSHLKSLMILFAQHAQNVPNEPLMRRKTKVATQLFKNTLRKGKKKAQE